MKQEQDYSVKELMAMPLEDLVRLDFTKLSEKGKLVVIKRDPVMWAKSFIQIYNIDLDKFVCLINLLCKIEKWWFINFEYPLSMDDYDDHPIDFDEVMTPSQWQLKLLLDIALGNEPEENFYFNSIVNRNI